MVCLLLKVTVIILEVIYKHPRLHKESLLAALVLFTPVSCCFFYWTAHFFSEANQMIDSLKKKKSLRLKACVCVHCLLSQSPGMMYLGRSNRVSICLLSKHHFSFSCFLLSTWFGCTWNWTLHFFFCFERFIMSLKSQDACRNMTFHIGICLWII